MKTLEIKSTFQVFENIEELDPIEKNLLVLAHEASKQAYAPYSNFFVGAAILLENGNIVKGNNQENIAYPSGLCAERVAIFAAGANYPGIKIKLMAVVAKSTNFKLNKPVSPCGSCRQSMAEYEARYMQNIPLLMQGESGEILKAPSILSLLPLVFEEKGLKGEY